MLRHTTNTLLPDAATCGKSSSSASLLTLTGLLKLAPLSVLRANNMSKVPGLLSDHTTYTLLPSAAIFGNTDVPGLLLRLTGLPKLDPLSVLRANNMSKFPGLLSNHTAYALVPTAAISGWRESPRLLLRSSGAPKVSCASAGCTNEPKTMTYAIITAIITILFAFLLQFSAKLNQPLFYVSIQS